MHKKRTLRTKVTILSIDIDEHFCFMDWELCYSESEFYAKMVNHKHHCSGYPDLIPDVVLSLGITWG